MEALESSPAPCRGSRAPRLRRLLPGIEAGPRLSLRARDSVRRLAAERDPDRHPPPGAAPPLVDLPAGGVPGAPVRPELGGRLSRCRWCCRSSRRTAARRSSPRSASGGFSDAPGRFDTLRRMAVFIVAAGPGGAVPLLSSRTPRWWRPCVASCTGRVWRTRFFSNVLTELTLVPTLVMVISAGPRWLRRATHGATRRPPCWPSGLLVTGWLVFRRAPLTIPGAPRHPPRLPLALPAVGGRAVRTGRCQPGAPGDDATQAIRARVHGRGPFTGLPPAEGVLDAPIFLSVVVVPLLCLAALIVERRYAKEALGGAAAL